jgi:hypothetical protein
MEKPMDADTARRLLDLLSDARLEQLAGKDPADPLATMLRQARDEALIEAKAQLKQMLVQAILDRTLEPTLEPTPERPDPSAHAAAPKATPEPAAAPTTAPPESPPAEAEAVLSEIEAIRRQIAENEARLTRVKAPPAPAVTPPVAVEPSPDAGAAEMGYYVYAILGTQAEPGGLPALEGIEPTFPVYLLPYQEVCAAVSLVPLSEFGEAPLKERLEDLAWVEARVRRHQATLEALMAWRTLVPLRFCTIYTSEDRVRETLAQEHASLAATLSRLTGKQEWGVKLFLTKRTLEQKVSEVSPAVQQLTADLAKRPSGAAYFAKKKLEEVVASEVERLGDEYAQRSHDSLAQLAVAARINPLQRQEVTGRDEAMLLNAAYLVAEERWETFRSQLAALSEENRALGFSYDLTGPWPPYNFVGPQEGGNGEPARA